MTEAWSLPGFDVQSLLGFGATGEVWRARDLATGDTVALKRLRQDADPAAVDALRREAVLLATLDTPYVVRLREVVACGVDAVLVLDHAGGGSLATLLARRGTLDPGEVVTVAAPLAQALAAAHARGLVHGDVTPSNVLFTGDGMPLLSDLGVARAAGQRPRAADRKAEYLDPAVAAGGAPDAAADVWALAAVCHHMLVGSPPHEGEQVGDALGAVTSGRRPPRGLLAPDARALMAAVEAALVTDPSARPGAAAFASSVRRAYAAAPVRLTGGASGAAANRAARSTHAVPKASAGESRVQRRRVPQGLLLGGALLALVVMAGVVGWASARDDVDAAAALPALSVPPSVTATAPAVVAVDWRHVLQELDTARAEAFAQGDVAALSQVYATGAPALGADARLLQSLVDRGQTAHGLRHDIHALDVLEESPRSVRLRVVDLLVPYEVRNARGAVVSRAAGRGERAFLVELARNGEGWRLVEVRPEG